jgi:hypothetical protein
MTLETEARALCERLRDIATYGYQSQLARQAADTIEALLAGEAPQIEDFAPCPTCRQYSHSIGNDAVTAAFNHFQAMYAHPVRGHPMGHVFEEETRDAAQVMMGLLAEKARVVAWLREYAELAREIVPHDLQQFNVLNSAAAKIERGEHLKETDNGRRP